MERAAISEQKMAGTCEISGGHLVRNTLINSILIIASVFFSLAIAEIYFRLFNPQPIIPRYVETSPYGIRKNIGHVRGMMIVPEYRHRFDTNSQGFRGVKEYAQRKPAGVYRIVVLGDSVTLGHGVEDEATFSFLLEQHLSRIRSTEVINMGVSGFGTAEELVQLRQVGLTYQPDLVILGYFPNDPYNNIVSKLFKVENATLVQQQQAFVPAIYIRDRLYNIPGYSFLCQHSHLVNFARNRLSDFFMKRLADQNNVSLQTTESSPEQADLTASLLNEISAQLSQRNIPLIILNIPIISNGKAITNLPTERLLQHEGTVSIVDVNEQIYAGHSIGDMSYGNDLHPKPLAHKLIAEWLAAFIRHRIWQANL